MVEDIDTGTGVLATSLEECMFHCAMCNVETTGSKGFAAAYGAKHRTIVALSRGDITGISSVKSDVGSEDDPDDSGQASDMGIVFAA